MENQYHPKFLRRSFLGGFLGSATALLTGYAGYLLKARFEHTEEKIQEPPKFEQWRYSFELSNLTYSVDLHSPFENGQLEIATGSHDSFSLSALSPLEKVMYEYRKYAKADRDIDILVMYKESASYLINPAGLDKAKKSQWGTSDSPIVNYKLPFSVWVKFCENDVYEGQPATTLEMSTWGRKVVYVDLFKDNIPEKVLFLSGESEPKLEKIIEVYQKNLEQSSTKVLSLADRFSAVSNPFHREYRFLTHCIKIARQREMKEKADKNTKDN